MDVVAIVLHHTADFILLPAHTTLHHYGHTTCLHYRLLGTTTLFSSMCLLHHCLSTFCSLPVPTFVLTPPTPASIPSYLDTHTHGHCTHTLVLHTHTFCRLDAHCYTHVATPHHPTLPTWAMMEPPRTQEVCACHTANMVVALELPACTCLPRTAAFFSSLFCILPGFCCSCHRAHCARLPTRLP